MNMITRSYTVRFLTPAFLGDAEQNGAWRTPPFKALLRQWWRVAMAAVCRFDVDILRKREAALFGSAADGEGTRSLIRIRLSRWDEGKLTSWAGLESARIPHPEVRAPVGAHLYLGYGPLVFAHGGTVLKRKAAVQPGETAEFKLAFPGEYTKILDMALRLMDRYGTLGGRSRNGWGSFSLISLNGTPPFPEVQDGGFVRNWKDALSLDWPHAIGATDGKPLIWETDAMADWKVAMKRLAELKIGLRTQFKFPNAQPPHTAPLQRHWLSYPVTKHTTSAWDRNARLPNSLRFKVRHGADGKLHGVIFHIPCQPPEQFRPDLGAIQAVWQRVHAYLDDPAQKLSRIPE